MLISVITGKWPKSLIKISSHLRKLVKHIKHFHTCFPYKVNWIFWIDIHWRLLVFGVNYLWTSTWNVIQRLLNWIRHHYHVVNDVFSLVVYWKCYLIYVKFDNKSVGERVYMASVCRESFLQFHQHPIDIQSTN